MVVDTYSREGVNFYLEHDLDGYRIIRQEGRYKHKEYLGKIDKEEAEIKFYNYVNR